MIRIPSHYFERTLKTPTVSEIKKNVQSQLNEKMPNLFINAKKNFFYKNFRFSKKYYLILFLLLINFILNISNIVLLFNNYDNNKNYIKIINIINIIFSIIFLFISVYKLSFKSFFDIPCYLFILYFITDISFRSYIDNKDLNENKDLITGLYSISFINLLIILIFGISNRNISYYIN
jgi:hypothetical protein